MRRELLDYDLPPELIATHPPPERDGARLLVLGDGPPATAAVRELDRFVQPGTLLVVNDTRVIPARLLGHKAGTGGRAEVLLVRRIGPDSVEGLPAERWSALGRSSKPLRPGARIVIEPDAAARRARPEDDESSSGLLGARRSPVRGMGRSPIVTDPPPGHQPLLCVEIASVRDAGMLEVLVFSPADAPIDLAIERCGHVPLPPYMHRGDEQADRERYQTVFARVPGAVAAPTAGLHLTEALLSRLRARGVETASVTLHVGLGTFQPVTAEDLDDHPMHEEVFAVPAETVEAIARARHRGAPVLAIGTTVVRALESAADPDRPGHALAAEGETRLLIQPGYRFRVVDQLLTNFHLPQSTLLALVSAFAGRERVLEAYRRAIAERFRFYSYGDAMLVQARAGYDGGRPPIPPGPAGGGAA